jgi:hypothetical protein
MIRFGFLLLLGVALNAGPPAAAQRVIDQTTPLTAGQRVFLNLKHANTIRVRAGSGSEMKIHASVSINQNRLNDALSLRVNRTAGEVTVVSELDKKMLERAQPGDCPPDGNGSYYGSNWGSGNSGQRVCMAIDYEVSLPAGTELQVKTISGNIDIDGLTGPIDAKSISGFVDISWPAAKGAVLALKTITGEVYTDQDIAFTNRKENPLVGYELKGTLGGNGPAVQLESISGDVFFRKRK